MTYFQHTMTTITIHYYSKRKNIWDQNLAGQTVNPQAPCKVAPHLQLGWTYLPRAGFIPCVQQSDVSWLSDFKHLGISSVTQVSLRQLYTMASQVFHTSCLTSEGEDPIIPSVSLMTVNPSPHRHGWNFQLWLLAWDGAWHTGSYLQSCGLLFLSRNRKLLRPLLFSI